LGMFGGPFASNDSMNEIMNKEVVNLSPAISSHITGNNSIVNDIQGIISNSMSGLLLDFGTAIRSKLPLTDANESYAQERTELVSMLHCDDVVPAVGRLISAVSTFYSELYCSLSGTPFHAELSMAQDLETRLSGLAAFTKGTIKSMEEEIISFKTLRADISEIVKSENTLDGVRAFFENFSHLSSMFTQMFLSRHFDGVSDMRRDLTKEFSFSIKGEISADKSHFSVKKFTGLSKSEKCFYE
jgi:hypothetical protein